MQVYDKQDYSVEGQKRKLKELEESIDKKLISRKKEPYHGLKFVTVQEQIKSLFLKLFNR